MKHPSSNQARQHVSGMNAPPEQTKYGTIPIVQVDVVVEEMHRRAEYVGSVLEEILQAGHERVNWAESI
ncbi:MAG TPA: hypothetical protein VNX46_17580 [Candidatus Acidoferrum sp.]|nr:hypothetical protein [Candidatus Acidoferrum sp.]